MNKNEEELIRVGRIDYDNNETNFKWELQRHIKNDELPFDHTTRIKVFYNFNEGSIPYFKFHINNFPTDYYPYNFDFKNGRKYNVDELPGIEVIIYDWYGHEIL